jgi:hypothetical protein
LAGIDRPADGRSTPPHRISLIGDPGRDDIRLRRVERTQRKRRLTFLLYGLGKRGNAIECHCSAPSGLGE